MVHNSMACMVQVVSCVGMIMWCTETESVLTSDRDRLTEMQRWYSKNVTQLDDLTDLVRGKLTSIQRKSVVALVTQGGKRPVCFFGNMA